MGNDKKQQIRTARLLPNMILDDSEIVLDITPGRARRLYVGQEGVKVKDLVPFVAGASPTINGQLVQDYRFVRTTDSNGDLYLDLTTLIPGITAAYFLSAVTTAGNALFGGVEITDLNNYKIVLGTAGDLSPIPDTEILVSIAAVIG